MWPSFFLSLAACRDAVTPAEDRGWMWFAGDVTMGAGGNGALALVDFPGPGVVNLEGAMGPRLDLPKRFNQGIAMSELSAAGVRVVGIANEHADDADSDAPKLLRAAGLLPAGREAGPAVLEVDGVRVVIAAAHVPSATLVEDLRAADRQGEVLAASLHVDQAADAVEAVASARAAGAEIVVVHGAGLGAVEVGPPLVAWGLGELVVTGAATDAAGLVLRVHLPDLRHELVAVQVGEHGGAVKPHPTPSEVFGRLRRP